jgi:SAM-dependent methyltransferase
MSVRVIIFAQPMAFDAKQYAPATQRNRQPILAVLERTLPPTGTVLEIASGTGEHAAFFAPRLQPRQWLPSDLNADALASIAAWRTEAEADNLHAPLQLDVSASSWSLENEEAPPRIFDLLSHFPLRAIVAINLIHISSWESCLGLMAGAGRLLPEGGVLYLYGPFQQGGRHTAPSNAAFDQALRHRHRAWGVRHLEEVVTAAETHHLSLREVVAMPANNLSVIFTVGS